MKSFSIIVAVDRQSGIGKDGGLPWNLPLDLKHFKTISTQAVLVSGDHKLWNTVIMGRKTWDSLPAKYQPLPGRKNIVITRQKDLALPPGVRSAQSLPQALNLLQDEAGEIFVIGGGQIFTEAIDLPHCQKLYVTQIEKDFLCDTFFPDVSNQFTEVKREGPFRDQETALYFCEYQRNKS